jgi:hypothetical protein
MVGLSLFFMVDRSLGLRPWAKQLLCQLVKPRSTLPPCAAAKDAIHLKNLLVELGQMPNDFPIRIAEDNSAAIAHAEAGLAHIRNAKHYAVRLRFLQQLVLDKEVEFVYTPTDEQLADFMTKPLDVTKFQRFRDVLLSVVALSCYLVIFLVFGSALLSFCCRTLGLVAKFGSLIISS